MRDLVIVGGGAAGIGAATEASRRGVDGLIIEAANRLGGRAHSIDWNGFRLDLGCTWMHSAERNSLRREAERIGAQVDDKPTSWFGQFRDLGWSKEDQDDAHRAFAKLEQRMKEHPPASDRASDALEPDTRWRAWLDAISGYINGAPLEDVSVGDWLAYDSAASSKNLRVVRGYGGLLVELGSRFAHHLGTPVSTIRRLKDRVQLDTSDGTIDAEHVIVTVPTATLSKIHFDPPIPLALQAAEQLPLGLADKLFLELTDPEEFPRDAHLIGNPHTRGTGSYFVRPMGMPVVEAFYGGVGARALEEMSDAEATGFAIEELSALFGSNFRTQVQPLARSRWLHEPFLAGSYSHALPGCAGAREQLANAGDDRIAFAGEAVSRSDYSTAHGAYDSGGSAVRRLFG